jgi:hypothetical protein
VPTVKQHTVYTFDELSDKAKGKALDECRDWNVNDSFWYEFALEDWKEQLQASGIEDAEIHFTGFWSQGDGASFTGRVDLPAWMKATKKAGKYRALYNAAIGEGDTTASATLDRIDSHYYHEYTVRAHISVDASSDIYYNDKERWERLNDQATEIEQELTAWHERTARTIYKELQEEYEYQTSDEQVAESLIANEVTFNENGSTYRH